MNGSTMERKPACATIVVQGSRKGSAAYSDMVAKDRLLRCDSGIVVTRTMLN